MFTFVNAEDVQVRNLLVQQPRGLPRPGAHRSGSTAAAQSKWSKEERAQQEQEGRRRMQSSVIEAGWP